MEQLIKILKIGLAAGQLVVGLGFIFAALAKIQDLEQFQQKVLDYLEIIGWSADFAAWVPNAIAPLLLLEFAIGLGLVLRWQLQVVFPLAIVAMLCFEGLSLYMWHVGFAGNCGCWGEWVVRTPQEAAVENALIIGVLALSWWQFRRPGADAAPRDEPLTKSTQHLIPDRGA